MKYHKLSAPYHPSTNGQVERYVQTVKNALYAMRTTKESLRRNINEFLRQYRKAPHSTTGQAPSRLFLGRELRTRLNLVLPEEVHTKISEKQRAHFNATFRTLRPSQAVYFLSQNHRMDKWIPGIVAAKLGDLHYEIEYLGRRFKRHIDQIRARQHVNKDGDRASRRVRFYEVTAEQTTPRVITNEATPESYRLEAPVEKTPTLPRRTTRMRRAPSRFSPG